MLNHSTRPDKKPVSVFDLAVDVGTSPHGLSADIHLAHQETQEAPFCPLPAKPLLTFDLSDELPEEIEEIDEAYYMHLLVCDLLSGGRHD